MLKQYPDELTNYNVGKSYEKRNIRAVKLSRKSVKKFLKRLFHQIKSNYKIQTILYFFGVNNTTILLKFRINL